MAIQTSNFAVDLTLYIFIEEFCRQQKYQNCDGKIYKSCNGKIHTSLNRRGKKQGGGLDTTWEVLIL